MLCATVLKALHLYILKNGSNVLFMLCICQIIARVSVDNRTRALVKGLQRVTDVKLLTTRVEELSYHLLEFPETRGVAIKVSVNLQTLKF